LPDSALVPGTIAAMRASILPPAWALAAAAGVALAGCAAGGSARPENDAAADAPALRRVVQAGCGSATSVSGAVAALAGLKCVPEAGYAVLKDVCGPAHFLLIPLARRSGIESPELLQPEEPDWFALAWAERGVVAGALGAAALPDAALGLAINSSSARSQDQLHIHIDRLRPDVAERLRGPAEPGGSYTLAGESYVVERVASLQPSPFRVVAARIGAGQMARASIAVAADGEGGYYVISRVAPGAHAENLLVTKVCPSPAGNR